MFNLNNLRISSSILLILAPLVILASGLLVLHHTAIPAYLFLGMAVSGIAITIHFILKYGLAILPNSIIRCDASEESLYLTQKNGERIKAVAMTNSFITPYLMLLAWKPAHPHSGWRNLFTPTNLAILTFDNISSCDDFRRLRVLLKFGKLSQPQTNTGRLSR